jgi:hypothetical protein
MLTYSGCRTSQSSNGIDIDASYVAVARQRLAEASRVQLPLSGI